MCGRFVQASPEEAVRNEFGLDFGADLAPGDTPSYNVAPTMRVAAIRIPSTSNWPSKSESSEPSDSESRSQTGAPELIRLRWGLIPFWAKDMKIGPRLINARAESIHKTPAFRDAFARRRCIIPADGFYEWKKGQSGKKQPYLIRLSSHRPFALAGLWERWRSPDGDVIESTTIVTTKPNKLVADLHNRMPVILDETARTQWLDPGETDADRLRGLLKPFAVDPLEAVAVSDRVNKVANDDPSLIEPLEARPQLELL